MHSRAIINKSRFDFIFVINVLRGVDVGRCLCFVPFFLFSNKYKKKIQALLVGNNIIFDGFHI